MPHRAYGAEHQAIRARLIAELAANPGRPCPGRCGGVPMFVWQRLQLGHTNRADKLAGKPGDRLEHAWCGEGEHSIPPQNRPAKPVPFGEAPPGSRYVTMRSGCDKHHLTRLMPASARLPDSVPACPCCGGVSNARRW
ncbi:MAG: hypothetical protein ACLPKI_22185 [Streptosporangiaceae bacterium]